MLCKKAEKRSRNKGLGRLAWGFLKRCRCLVLGCAIKAGLMPPLRTVK